jgi:hypothetical protein
MKKVLALALTVGLGLAAAAIAQDSTQSNPQNPTSPQSSQDKPQATSGKSLTGTITSIDNNQKMFIVRDDAGQTVTVYWNDATRVSGDLKEGATVSVQTNDEGGKTLATTIQVRTKKSY